MNAKRKIDIESKKFAKKLSLDDKMKCHSNNHAYITFKDHKENSKSNIRSRLINPSKSEVGLVSKCYLSNIIADASKETNINQWRNTSMVHDWCKIIANKQNESLSNLT